MWCLHVIFFVYRACEVSVASPVEGWQQTWFTSVSFPLAQLKELCETIVERLKTREMLRLQFDHCYARNSNLCAFFFTVDGWIDDMHMRFRCAYLSTDTNKITSLREERTKIQYSGKSIPGDFMEKLLRNEQHLVDAEKAFLACHNAVSTDMDLLWSERVLLMTPIVMATMRMQLLVGQRWASLGELCQADTVSR